MMWGAIFAMIEDRLRAIQDWVTKLTRSCSDFNFTHPVLGKFLLLMALIGMATTGWTVFSW